MNVLITGIDGFTGKHLETLLISKSYTVFGTVINRPDKDNHIECDIRHKDQVYAVINQIKPDYIFHLAAISFIGEKDKSLIYDVNVLGTQNILDSLIFYNLNPRKIIIASSATVYGNQGANILDESMCPKPANHYGYSKLAMEHLAITYFSKLNILITRPFNYTGIGHNENFIIPKIVKHFKSKKTNIELGNLDIAREFNDIRIVIDIYFKLMTCNAKSDIVNICTGNVIKLKEILLCMQEIAGYKINIQVNPEFIRKNEIYSLKGSTKKMYNMIGIVNGLDIKHTLKLMYQSEI